MKREHLIVLTIVLVVIIIGAGTYGAYTLLNPSATPEPTSTPEPTTSPTTNPSETTSPTATPSQTTQPTPTTSPTSTPTPTPTPTPSPTSVVVDDATGAQVNISLPVNRIVCLTSAETVCALGGGSKIVGIAGMLTTDVKAVLPASILNLPLVGDRDTSPNLEVIVELNPDVVLASQRLTDEHRKTLEDAGIAVLEDSVTGDRRIQYFTNLGLILDAEERVEELLSYEQYYWDLVEDRVGSLPRSEKPLVFFEWYMAWFSTGPEGSYTKLIEAAGGINIGENASTSSPQLSAEFIVEQNPDIIIRMLDYTSGEDLAAFQNLYNQIVTRPAVQGLNAEQNDQVYVIKSTLLVERDTIGLLYFAKWFHPDLFTDINPATVHAEMIQKYFGTTVTGVYLYP
ncbi:MAG: ABC transporter substrate-binding protein [Candidatus Bathyarchaeia archaeon]